MNPTKIESPTIDQVGVEERVSKLKSRSIKKNSKVHALKMVLSMIDLTTLSGDDTSGKVRQLCYKALHLHDTYAGLPTVAAVCVYPSMVKFAVEYLKGSDINVASVATSFPSGQSTIALKLEALRC